MARPIPCAHPGCGADATHYVAPLRTFDNEAIPLCDPHTRPHEDDPENADVWRFPA